MDCSYSRIVISLAFNIIKDFGKNVHAYALFDRLARGIYIR